MSGHSSNRAPARHAPHPGEILADKLEILDLSGTAPTREHRVPTNRVTQILSGKRAITTDDAMRLGQWFSSDPELWLNLQEQHVLDIAEQMD